MIKNLRSFISATFLFLIPMVNSAQLAPDLGTASGYALFTVAGAISANNTVNNLITGDLGITVGAYPAPNPTVSGATNVANPAAVQAGIDVCAAYADLAALSQGCSTLVGNLGGQTLTPGVYCKGDATIIDGILILDAQGDPNAEFIILIDAALSMGNVSSISLINSASECNVFFRVNGATSIGTNSTFRGNLLGNGALSMSPNSTIFGRALLCTGAVGLTNATITLNPSCVVTLLPVTLTSFNAAKKGLSTLLTWSTANEQNSSSFSIERSNSATASQWTVIGNVPAAVNSTSIRNYSFMDNGASKGANYYRLVSIGQDGKSAFSNIKMVLIDAGSLMPINIYPNPAKSMFTLTGATQGSRIIIMDLSGKQLSMQTANGSGTDRVAISNMANGIYHVKVLAEDGSSSVLKLNKQ